MDRNLQLDIFRQGFEAGRLEGLKIKESYKRVTHYIPALVRYKEVPAWWKGGKQKVDLMGAIVLVKQLETTNFPDSWVSIRENTGGKGIWSWQDSDLIFWPTEEQFKMEQARLKLSKGFK